MALFGTYKVTAPFGSIDTVHPVPHTGLDLAIPTGTPATVPVDGTVIRVLDEGTQNLGKSVMLQLKDGSKLVYGHLQDFGVSMGQRVSAGDAVGITGNTGHSTGPHLHVSLYNAAGNLVDPKPILDLPQQSHGWLGTAWNLFTKPGADLLYGAKTSTFDAFQQLLDPAATILALALLFLTMMGSKRARKYLYWDIAGYIVLKLILTSI